MVYDLTGDAKTAVKGSVNKYNRNYTTDFANRYDPLALQSDTRNWSDCDYTPGTSTCSGRVLPTNGDGIAQDNEIGPSNNRNLGIVPTRRADPNLARPYDIEYSLGVTRQVMRGVSVTGAWYRRDTYDLEQQINTLVTVDDFAIVHHAEPARHRRTRSPSTTSIGRSRGRSICSTPRPPIARRRASATPGSRSASRRGCRAARNLFGGWSADRLITVGCAGFDPNTFRYLRPEPVRHSVPLGFQVDRQRSRCRCGIQVGARCKATRACRWR